MAAKKRPYTSKDVTLAAGHRLRYYDWAGTGPALILLHGSSGYGLLWEWTANELGDRFHVIAPDQRSHGDSDSPNGDYCAEEYARDVHELIQALGLGTAFVGGYSLGGRAAQVFAALYPDECEGLILVGGLHLSTFFHERDRTAGVIESAYRAFRAPTEFASREEALTFLRGMRQHDTEESHAHRISHNMDRSGETYRFKYDPVRVTQGRLHMNTDLRKHAALVTCPVAIFRSTTGSELATWQEARDLARIWRNATVRDVAGDSLLHITGPAGLAAAITDFITSSSAVNA